jgi:hypothetical protein
MDAQSLAEIVGIVRDGGSTALLLVVIVGGFKGWFVWRWQYDEKIAAYEKQLHQVTAERDDWKDTALRGLSVAERVAG